MPASASARTRKGDKYLLSGRRAETANDFERAIEEYDKALIEDPAETSYQLASRRMHFEVGARKIARAQTLRTLGKLEEALLEFQQAFLVDPSSSLAVQEVKRTVQMLEAEKLKGVKAAPELRGLTPAQQAQRESDERISHLQPVPELKPVSRQVTSLRINNQPVKVLYETLGKLTGINVIFDSEYQAPSRNFNVDLTNTTLWDALEYLGVLTKSFWKPLSSNTIFVTNDNITRRRDYEDNVVKVFYLKNMTSPQELNDITTNIRSVTEIRRLYPYASQNAVIARGKVDEVLLVEKLLNDLDKPRPEVLIDVIVMEASTGRTRQLAATVTSGSTPGLSFNVQPQLGGVAPASGATASLPLNQLSTLRTSDFAVNLPGALLAAVMSDRSARIKQTPQVRAADGQKATLRIGDKVPTASGSFQPGIGSVGVSPLVNTQFQYLEVGVNVDITPRVHADNEMSLHVEIEISSVKERVDIGGIQQPVIGQRKVIHDLRLRDGEMNLIGGLVQTNESKSVSGIPGLMNIPYLGRFFSSENIDRSQNELLIILVPHIVRGQEILPINTRGIAAGLDQSIRLINSAHDEGGDAATAPTTPATPGAAPVPHPEEAAPAQPAIPQQPAAAPVQLTFQPEGVVTKAGSTAVVTLHVADAVDLFSAPLRVKYDPKILKLGAASAGAFLSGDGQRVNFTYSDNPGAGEVTINLNRLPGTTGLTGAGALVSLTFDTKAPGNSTVQVIDPNLKNSKLQPVPAQSPSIGIEVR